MTTTTIQRAAGDDVDRVSLFLDGRRVLLNATAEDAEAISDELAQRAALRLEAVREAVRAHGWLSTYDADFIALNVVAALERLDRA